MVGSPIPSSLSSPSATERLHSQPPSPNLHDNQRLLLNNDTARPVQGSDLEEEYGGRVFFPVTQAGPDPAVDGKTDIFFLP
ncbi:teneurin-3-like [Arapaima gigas]